jgi:propionyl-CoA carboxylase alpha chain
VDTGVYEGGEIPMHYDSMIAKLVVHGADRADAIGRMRAALDAFVIRGIASNVGFQASLLGHARFAEGHFDTGFIAETYPDGWKPDPVRHPDPDLLLAIAAAVHRRILDRAALLTGQLRGHEVRVREAFVLVATAPDGTRTQTPVAIRSVGQPFEVTVRGRTRTLMLEGAVRDLVVRGRCDGEAFCAQLERLGLGYRISHHGAQVEVRVLAPRAAELYALMPVKAPPDLSKFLLSPMPGLLVDVAVKAGQTVRAGERLAVIEAMKMENILLATQDRVVARVAAQKGETLAVDQVIVEFE